jgi:2,3-dihydroxybenzoate---[aryl-carrier protein] ligase
MLDGCTPWPEAFVQRYLREGYWEPQSLADLLEEQARAIPHRVFVSDGARHLTFREVHQISDHIAFHLLDLGLRPRDIVLLQLPNTWEFVVVFFALQKIGVIPVMCLPPHRNTELAYFAQATQAHAYFFAPRFRNFDYLAMAREIRAAVPSVERLIATGSGAESDVSYLDALMEPPARHEESAAALKCVRPDPFEVAFLHLSGGTTGIPKLIPRTHADYICNAKTCARVLGWDQSVVYVIAIPAAHNFSLGAPGMVAVLAAGGRVAYSPSTEPEAVFETIEKQRGTFLPVSPTLLIMLLNSPNRDRHDLTSLRFVCAGGQKMLPELVDRTWNAWSFATPGHAFGMAEGLTNLTRPDDPRDVIRETQGRPVSAADEIRIVDDEGKEAPPGAVGELITRGPYTIRGYYNAAEHNRTAFTDDGFYRTGDMVRLHPSGNLVVEGRRKDMINRGGEKISAEEVENLLLGHDGIHMAAVVAMPDPVMGERSCAFVIPKPGRTLRLGDLTSYLLERKIAKFKLPERLEMVESFPLTSVGKVSKKALRDQIAAKLIAEGK